MLTTAVRHSNDFYYKEIRFSIRYSSRLMLHSIIVYINKTKPCVAVTIRGVCQKLI